MSDPKPNRGTCPVCGSREKVYLPKDGRLTRVCRTHRIYYGGVPEVCAGSGRVCREDAETQEGR